MRITFLHTGTSGGVPHRRWLIAIVCTALLLRLGWVLSLKVGLIWADEQKYLDPAISLAAGRGFQATSFVPPGYPLFLSGIVRLWGPDYRVVRIVQCVLGAWSCWLLYGIARRLASERVGWLAAVGLAVYLPHIYLAGSLYTECFVTCLALLTLWLAVATPTWRHPWLGAGLTGLALGITTLTRSTFMIWLPVIGMAWLWTGWREWRRPLRWTGAFFTAWALLLASWTFRNYAVYGKFLPVSSGFPSMLWRANCLLARGDEWDRDLGYLEPHYKEVWDRRRAELSANEQRIVDEMYLPLFQKALPRRTAEIGDEFLARDELLGPLALAEIKARPLRCLVLASRRVLRFFSPFTSTNTRNAHTRPYYRWLASASFYPLLVLGLAGLLLQDRRQRLLTVALVTGVLFHAFVATATRLRLPLDPILIVFAALAVDRLWRRWERTEQHAALQ